MKGDRKTIVQIAASAVLAGALATVSGCALTGGPQHQQVRYFDLGTAPNSVNHCLTNTSVVIVSSSPALRGTRMWYRNTLNPHEIKAYAISRWSAPPAALINRLFAGSNGLTTTRQISAHITGMELQVGPKTAQEAVTQADQRRSLTPGFVLLELAADLRVGGKRLDSRLFSLRAQAAASPAGAAAAYREALLDWSAQLCDWAAPGNASIDAQLR